MDWTKLIPILTLFCPAFGGVSSILILFYGIMFRPITGRKELAAVLLAAAAISAGMVGGIFMGELPTVLTGWTTLLKSAFHSPDEEISLCWILVSSLLLAMLLFWPRRIESNRGELHREAWSGFALLTATFFLAIAADAWVQWGCMIWIGWLLCAVLSRDRLDAVRGRAAANCLVWFTLADFLWLAGLVTLSMVMPEGNLRYIFVQELVDQLSAGENALCVSGISLLVAGLVLRCSLYPLMSWSGPAAISSRDACWIIAFGFGPAMVMLLEWESALTAFPETKLLLGGAGVLSTLILGIMSWGGRYQGAGIVHCAASFLGFIWLGLGAELLLDWNLICLTFSSLWLLALFALAAGQRRDEDLSRIRSISLGILAVLLCSGLLGQEFLLEEVRYSESLSGLNPWMLVTGALLGLMLFSMNLFHNLGLNAARSSAGDSRDLMLSQTQGTMRWMILGVVGLAGTAGIFLVPMLASGNVVVPLRIPVLSGLAGLIGICAAFVWPGFAGQGTPGAASRFESLRRLAQAEFYIPAIINFALIIPIRAAAQISRLLEWIIIGNVTMKVPSQLLKGISEQATHLDEEAPEASQMWHLASATAVMLAGVALGAVMSLYRLW